MVNYCSGLGSLGPPSMKIPESTSRFCFVGDLDGTLCSALHCPDCNSPVKWHDGVSLDGSGRAAVEAFYASGPAVSPGPLPSRLYLCRCSYHHCWQSFSESLEYGRDYPELGLHVGWQCAGHPPLSSLPESFQGRSVGPGPDWPALIEHTFCEVPADDGARREPIDWLRQLRGVVTGTAAAAAIDDVVARLLDSADALLRGCALHFLRFLPIDSVLLQRLPALLLHDAERLRGQPDPLGPTDLYDVALVTCAAHVKSSEPVLDETLRTLLRAHALAENRLAGVGWLLATRDSQWFLAHFDVMVRSSPQLAGAAAHWKRQAVAEEALFGR